MTLLIKLRWAKAKPKGTDMNQYTVLRFVNTSGALIEFLNENETFYEQTGQAVKIGRVVTL